MSLLSSLPHAWALNGDTTVLTGLIEGVLTPQSCLRESWLLAAREDFSCLAVHLFLPAAHGLGWLEGGGRGH